MSYGVGHRYGSDLALLWLWRRWAYDPKKKKKKKIWSSQCGTTELVGSLQLWYRLQLWLRSNPWPENSKCHRAAKKENKHFLPFVSSKLKKNKREIEEQFSCLEWLIKEWFCTYSIARLLFGETSDTRAGAGNTQDEPGTSCSVKK